VEAAQYFYQLNDDLLLLTEGWADRFVSALESSTPPGFGIAGPLDLHNERLMTQSFASCTHYEIFGYYYPWRFRNWYSDDWAAQLYGESTHWLTDVEVDHGATMGPRYLVAYDHGTLVAPLVRSGRARICGWLSRTVGAGLAAEQFAPCGMEGFGVVLPPSPPPELLPPAASLRPLRSAEARARKRPLQPEAGGGKHALQPETGRRKRLLQPAIRTDVFRSAPAKQKKAWDHGNATATRALRPSLDSTVAATAAGRGGTPAATPRRERSKPR
jgi:hypothetical protein